MSEKKQNLNFVTPNKDQQKIFQDYLGKKLGTKALLVLEQLDKKTRELNYTFVYQYPERLVLASFDLTLDKDNKLKSFGSNLLFDGANSYKINIEDLILDYVKKSIEDTDVEVPKPEIDSEEFLDDDSVAAAEDYSTKSQATYFFDCGNKGNYKKDENGNIVTPVEIDNINSITSKGSFCCVLKRKKYQEKAVDNKKWLVNVDDDTDKIPYDSKQEKDNPKLKLDEMAYYILTAGHNLLNGKTEKTSTNKGSEYKLIKDVNNFVELELIKDYTNDGYDAAVLKIKQINKTGVKYFSENVYKLKGDQTPIKYYKKQDNKYYDIETKAEAKEINDNNSEIFNGNFKDITSTDFYKDAIKPKDLILNPTEKSYGKGYLIGIPVDITVNRVQFITDISYNEGSGDFSLKIENNNYQGMSGGLVITDLESLIGNFEGTNNDYKATYYDFSSEYKLIIT